jgi:Cysteine-rich CPXCG
MRDSIEVQCPYCFEWQELDLDPGTSGSFVQDCDVCCRPWQVFLQWQDDEPFVTVERAQ